jgi:hypothetical protein
MATAAKPTAKTSRDLAAEISYLTRAPKPPTCATRSTVLPNAPSPSPGPRLEFLVACLQREVSAR